MEAPVWLKTKKVCISTRLQPRRKEQLTVRLQPLEIMIGRSE